MPLKKVKKRGESPPKKEKRRGESSPKESGLSEPSARQSTEVQPDFPKDIPSTGVDQDPPKEEKETKGGKKKRDSPSKESGLSETSARQSTEVQRDTPKNISHTQVNTENFMFPTLRDAINKDKKYSVFFKNTESLTFHHHISKYKLDNFAANLTAYATYSGKTKELNLFYKNIKEKLFSYIENYDLPLTEIDDKNIYQAKSISRILIQLPFNLYAGYFFNNGNPGSEFDPQINPETGQEFQYVSILRQLEQLMAEENIPGKGQDKEWKTYFDRLNELFNRASETWSSETGGKIYADPKEWIVRDSDNGTKIYAKKIRNIIYKRRSEILEFRNKAYKDVNFKKQQASIKEAFTKGLQELIEAPLNTKDDKVTIQFSIFGNNVERMVEHILNRHTFFGIEERRLIDTYFHKEGDTIDAATLINNFMEAITKLRQGLANETRDTFKKYIDLKGTETDFSKSFNEVGMQATLALDEDSDFDFGSQTYILPTETPIKLKLRLKSIYPNGDKFLGEDSD